MRTTELKMERQSLIEISQEVEVTERVGTSSCNHIIEPAIAMFGCYTGHDRTKSAHDIVKGIRNSDRGYYVIVDFDE